MHPYPAHNSIGEARVARRAFRVFWAGQSVSWLGDAFGGLAFPLLVVQTTGSAAQLGFVSATVGASALAMGLPAGALVDRLDRRRLLIGVDLALVGVFATIPIGFRAIGPRLWIIYAVAAFAGAFSTMSTTGAAAIVPDLVPPERLGQANGRLQATSALAYALGPALGGPLCQQIGVTSGFAIDAATFAVAALSLALLRVPRAAPASTAASVRQTQRLSTGVRFLWGDPALRGPSIVAGGLSFTMVAVPNLFVFRLKHELHHSDSVVGLMLGSAALGAVLGSALVASLRRRFGFRSVFLATIGTEVAALAAAASARSVIGIAVIAAAFTSLEAARRILYRTHRQLLTPAPLQGRATAAYGMLSTAAALAGSIATALIAQWRSTSTALAVAAAAVAVYFIAGARGPFALDPGNAGALT